LQRIGTALRPGNGLRIHVEKAVCQQSLFGAVKMWPSGYKAIEILESTDIYTPEKCKNRIKNTQNRGIGDVGT
jgi:hypothetical protein